MEKFNSSGRWVLGGKYSGALTVYYSTHNVIVALQYGVIDFALVVSLSELEPDFDSLAYDLEYWLQDAEINYANVNKYLSSKVSQRFVVESWIE